MNNVKYYPMLTTHSDIMPVLLSTTYAADEGRISPEQYLKMVAMLMKLSKLLQSEDLEPKK